MFSQFACASDGFCASTSGWVDGHEGVGAVDGRYSGTTKARAGTNAVSLDIFLLPLRLSFSYPPLPAPPSHARDCAFYA